MKRSFSNRAKVDKPTDLDRPSATNRVRNILLAFEARQLDSQNGKKAELSQKVPKCDSKTKTKDKSSSQKNEPKEDLKKEEDEYFDMDDDLFQVADVQNSDTFVAILYLRNCLQIKSFSHVFPPMVMRHQLYCVLKDRTLTDRQLVGAVSRYGLLASLLTCRLCFH